MEPIRVDVATDGPALPPGPGRWAVRVATVAGMALLAAGLWARGLPSFVAWEVARDHQRCLGRRHLPARVWSEDPADVRGWLEARGTPVPLLPTHAHASELLGARYCPLVDRVAAHVYYGDAGESAVSVFVLPGPARIGDGWAGQARGLHVRLLRAAGRPIAIVGGSRIDVETTARAFTTTVAGARSGLVPRG